MAVYLLCFLFTLSVVSGYNIQYGGEIIKQFNISDVVLSELPQDIMKDEDVATHWDWREKGLQTTDLNQHIPVYCGSCWAHSTVSSIGDRLKIANKGQQRDILPSVQVLLNCGTAGSCGGGDVHAAYRWIYVNGIPDVTCAQYEAKDGECSEISTCSACGGDGCEAILDYPVIKIKEYGRVIGDVNIQKEIQTRGPVSCYINGHCLEESLTSIYAYDSCEPYLFNHAIQLSGWGTEDGVDYWIGRNSWGTYWADRGFFRIVRGGAYDPIGCYWGVPEAVDF